MLQGKSWLLKMNKLPLHQFGAVFRPCSLIFLGSLWPQNYSYLWELTSLPQGR